MSVPVPSLSANGWVTETFAKADILLGHFFVSESSQSNVYKGQVASLPGIVQKFGANPDEMAKAVESNVAALFNRYFISSDTEVVTVSVKSSVTNANDDSVSRYELKLDVSVTINGQFYSLGRIVNVENSTIKKIIALNNG
jgi:hypothetical protein